MSNKSSTTYMVSRSAQRRQREKKMRFQTILAAAETLFAREGYHGTSMEQIASLAEVSVGTLYFYFKNKEDLLIRLLDDIAYKMREMVGNEFQKADSSLEAFRSAGMVFFEEFCPNCPEKLAIIFRETVGQSAVLEQHRKRIFDKFIGDVQGALVRLSEKKKISFKNPLTAQVLATSIVGMYERTAYQYLILDERSADMESISNAALDFIMGGISNSWADE